MVAATWGVALLTDSVAHYYNQLLAASTSSTADAALVLHASVDRQRQSWDELLLHGEDGEQLVKYASRFREDDSSVAEGVATLQRELSADPEAQRLLARFLSAHSGHSKRFAALLSEFERAGHVDQPPVAARASTLDGARLDSLDRLIAYLSDSRESSRAQLRQFEASVELAGGILTACLVLAAYGSRLRLVPDHARH